MASQKFRQLLVALTIGSGLPGAASAEAQPEPIDPPLRAETAPPTLSQRADLAEANAAIRAKDYARAESILAELARSFPEDPRLLLLRGEVLLALSRPDEALPWLERAAAIDPTGKRAHFQLAQALQARGDRAGALAAYAKEIELNDDLEVRNMARLNLVVLLQQGGDWAQAAAELERLLGGDPAGLAAYGDPARLYGDLASLYLEAAQFDKASGALERGLEHGFRSAEHFYGLGARLSGRGDLAGAIAALERALEIDPGLAEAERSLGAALDEAGREQEAARHLRRYLELKPAAPDAVKVRDRLREIEGR